MVSETYQVFRCPMCARRRRIYHTRGGKGLLHLWVCSQGHHWTTEVSQLEKIVDVSRVAVMASMSRLFTDSPFLDVLRRRG